MKPAKIVLFMLGVFLLLAFSMWVVPPNGVKVGGVKLQMPEFDQFLPGNRPEYTDVSKIIDKQFNIDSLVAFEPDSLQTDSVTRVIHKANYDSLVNSLTKIEFYEEGKNSLWSFFSKLESDSTARIMHYGDSQIEGDRITAFVRNKLQQKFGGSGPGLRPALQPYDYVFTAHQENTGNWKRYPIYGDVDSTLLHNRYGAMAAFSRFAPHATDSIPEPDSVWYEAGLSISSSAISFKMAREYEKLRLFYGNSRAPVFMEVFAADSLIFADSLKQNVDFAVSECFLPDSTNHVSIDFKGFDSPDIYGFELATEKGVIVDNIALRGSSGLIFTRNEFEHSKKMYQSLAPDLFILQFGGNVVPYITEKEAIKKYSQRFKSQLQRLLQINPNAVIIVIGPADMSTKNKDLYVTYDHLPTLVEELKNSALSAGCGFWDMYEAMGGKNSMPSWVNAEPELARPDYVHFSARGARVIANMFYNALVLEYNNYLLDKNQKQ